MAGSSPFHRVPLSNFRVLVISYSKYIQVAVSPSIEYSCNGTLILHGTIIMLRANIIKSKTESCLIFYHEH